MTTDFYELFEGREDAVFLDNPPRLHKVEYGFTDFVVNHLEGRGAIGIYPLRDGNRCKWICSDFDTSEAEDLAWRYAQAWEYYGIQAWVETSRSKGFHVWVFADDWMSGTIARRAGLWVHQMSQIEAVELNPKQELIGEGEYGNCVRLPYPNSGRDCTIDSERQVMWDTNGQSIGFQDWVPQALQLRTPVEQLQRLAAMWQPPPLPERKQYKDGPTRRGGNPDSNFDPYHIRRVFNGNENVRKGERDNVFHTLAMYCRGKDLSMSEARDIVSDVWSTQTDDRETYPLKVALEKVDRAYGR